MNIERYNLLLPISVAVARSVRTLGSIALMLLLLASGRQTAFAQGGMDSKGKEFWVAFMANLGSRGPGTEISDMRLYLSADRPTSVALTYTLTGDRRVINLTQANVPIEVNVNQVFGDFVELDDVTGGNEVQAKSIHVLADNDITLYGANIRSKSADAFLGLPLDVLTGRYIVLAYPNGYSGNFFGNGNYDTPSEFAVIATEDGTTVNIAPSGSLTLNTRTSASFAVTLNRGEVFFGQADVYPDQEQDVSGTQVNANKPVAVFAGNKRTSIPTRVGNFRDHLVEQLPPLDAWGRDAILTPHFKVTPSSTDTAVARIIAAFQGTDVTVTRAGSTQNFTLSPGVSVEVDLTEAMSVSATQPIMVAQYEHSVNVGGGPGDYDLGDPFMMLIPPTEQFDTAYAFQSIIHPEFANQHYVNVVIPQQGVASLRLDGAPISATFQPVPGSRFSYAQVKVSGGSHYIRSDSAFGLYVYGFGSANSYGYPGGMLFRRLVRDFEAPEMSTQSLCGDLQGYSFDSRITDTGIDSCYATSDTQNVVVDFDQFKPGADTVRFRARLIDPYRDGVVGVRSVDREGRSRTQVVSIPGFTLRFSGSNTAPAVADTFVAINAKGFCRNIEIKNYGRFPQTISGVQLSDTFRRAVDPAQFPLVIQPNGTATIEICFGEFADTVFTTMLTLTGPCGSRDVAIVPIDNRIDTTAPSVGIEGSPCSDEFIITYYERSRSSGIAAVAVDTTVNCTAESLVDPTKLPAQQVQIRLRRIDPRKDLVYKVTLFDAVGNKLIDSDTIGGFTVDLLGRDGNQIGARYDRMWEAADSLDLAAKTCDTVTITNFGSRPVYIERAVMRGNVLYSIPPSQLPFIVPPGGSKALTVCIEGRYDRDLLDTLLLYDACGHAEEVALMTPLRILAGGTTNGCGAVINVATFAPTKRNFLATPLPNPVAGAAHVDVGLTQAGSVTLRVFSAAGEPVLLVARDAQLAAGISRIAFSVADLEPGAYFCRMTTSDGSVHVAKMIVRR